jgi:hypothetical protein
MGERAPIAEQEKEALLKGAMKPMAKRSINNLFVPGLSLRRNVQNTVRQLTALFIFQETSSSSRQTILRIMTFFATISLYMSIFILSFSDATQSSKAEERVSSHYFLSPQDAAPIYSQVLSAEKGITFLWQLDYERESVTVEVQMEKRKSNKGKFMKPDFIFKTYLIKPFHLGI